MSKPKMAGQPFCFTDRSKNIKLVKDVEILRPIKFCEYSSAV